MQYSQLAVLALAFGAHARPQFGQWDQWDSFPPKEVSSNSNSNSNSSSSSATEASTAPTTTASATLSSDASSGGSIPASSGTSTLSAVQTIAAGDSFDGGMFVYDRGVSCTGQSEGGDSDAVFILEVSYRSNTDNIPN
jgi:hypothetical protein